MNLFTSQALSKTVSLPITLNYSLLRSLLLYTTYTGPDQTAPLLYESNGCRTIVMSEPRFNEENSRLRFETKVYIHYGKPFAEECLIPVQWEGYLVFFLKPRIDKQWNLSFKTLDFIVYDKNRNPVETDSSILELIKIWVFPYSEELSFDLASSIQEMKSNLLPLFPANLRLSAEEMLSSMRPGEVVIHPEAVQTEMLVNIKEEDIIAGAVREDFIPKNELKEYIAHWEAWDAFLVKMITTLPKQVLLDEERQILLETLLEIRHDFIAEVSDGTVKRDFIRKQFITAWERLSPLFRNYLGNKPSKAILEYLAFFMASDALSAFDEIIPTLGIEIRREDLIRLARLLIDKEPVNLIYSEDVNEELRERLGFGAPLIPSGPEFNGKELEIDREENELEQHPQSRYLHEIYSFFIEKAWAKKKKAQHPLPRFKSGSFRRKIERPT